MKFSFEHMGFKLSRRKRKLGIRFVNLGKVLFIVGKLTAWCLQLNVLLVSQNQYISVQAHYRPPNQLQHLCPFPIKHTMQGQRPYLIYLARLYKA